MFLESHIRAGGIMNKLTLLSALFLSLPILADDTEIYGAAAVDPSSRINPNIMFIMDTSGSMDGAVNNADDYDPSKTYIGDYIIDHIYHDLDSDADDGHPKAVLINDGGKYDCSTAIASLETYGRALENTKQRRKNGYWYQTHQDGSTYPIRCNDGWRNNWIYTGHYMNWYVNYYATQNSTRLQTVIDVLDTLTRTVKNVNFGLMRFDEGADGGMVDVPVKSIDESGPEIRTAMAGYDHNGGTPLTEVMQEAAAYYRGEKWIYGDTSTPNISVASSRKTNTSGDPSDTYQSPMESSCQKNHIILLTDGKPSSDVSADYTIRKLITDMYLPEGLDKDCEHDGKGNSCLDEFAYWLKNTDHSDTLPGTQDISTYTIGGFNLTDGVDLLKRAANYGGGQYYPADNAQALVKAMDDIVLKILAQDSTFTAPAVSVNAFNTSEHRDELYYALFRPDDGAKWHGNLKKYKIDSLGFVKDKNNQLAVDQTTGFFSATSQDFWNSTDAVDGPDVTQGGAASLLAPKNRTVYTENSGGNLVNFRSGTSTALLDMESASADEIENLKLWIEGYDINDINGSNTTTDSRKQIGDPLHSEPVVITYGGTQDAPDSTIFFGTNEGFLHAINTETGLEEFSYLPRELQKNQKIFYQDNIRAGDRPYGMDGAVSAWIKDTNQNNVILDSSGSLETNEHAYIYTGMRRGGRNYYALDVSNRNNPQMLFKIEGGVTPGFEKLGQTWSRMTVAKVKFDNDIRYVLLFSGGYDTNQDENTVKEDDTYGNAVFMVDAETGDLLWSASNEDANLNISEMTNSIPASISAVDINGDTLIDYFFAADTGGKIFRFDVNQNNVGAGNFAKGGVIASLAGNDEANNRRFYNKPDIGLVRDSQYGDYLTIAIGSGHRAFPVSTKVVENRFYVIKDYNVYRAPDSYELRTEAPTGKIALADNELPLSNKIYNATNLMERGESALTNDMRTIMNRGGGWYITFPTQGEKVLAQSVTFSGAIIFTTYSPTASTTSTKSCGANLGTSKIYALGQTNAMATIDLNDDGIIDSGDSSKQLTHSGIAPRPVVIYRQGGGRSIAIGTETIDDDRFKVKKPDPDCEANNTCGEDDPTMCEAGNCYLTPMYWRQNDNIN